MLSETQIERYSRQIILPQVGGRGQAALLSAVVTISGDGELATTAATYLAAAGVGHLRVAAPVASAIGDMNPDCELACLAADAAGDAVCGAAVVLCAAGATAGARMYAAAVAAGVPVIVTDATDTVGWMSVAAGTDIPCYGCLTRQAGHTSGAVAPLGNVTAACMGTALATEAIKIVLGLRPGFVGRVATFDILAGDVRDEPVMQDPLCPVCESRP